MDDASQTTPEDSVRRLLREKKLRRALLGGYSRVSVWETILEIVRGQRERLENAERENAYLRRRGEELERESEGRFAALERATDALTRLSGAGRVPQSDRRDVPRGEKT